MILSMRVKPRAIKTYNQPRANPLTIACIHTWAGKSNIKLPFRSV
jgi:hypothetical protein